MSEATVALTVMTAAILLILLGFLVWAIRSGQFRDIEEAKHRMLGQPLQPDEQERTTE